MKGTWQTTDHSSSAPVLLLIGVLLLAGGGGAVAAVSAAVIDALLAAVAVTVLTVIGLAVFVVHRARNPSPEGFVRTPLVHSTVHELPAAERPAIPQHLHLHFDGADPAAVAEILRRSQRPE